MRFIAIREIRYDAATDELRVVPADRPGPSYDAVWRAAMSARADDADELYTVNFSGRTPLAAYKQIVGAVVDEYHDILIPTADTVWTAVPDDLRRAIIAWHADEPAGA
jgi:hypothetical protein